jgi:hypothetical protein
MTHNFQTHYTPKPSKQANCPKCGISMHPSSVKRHMTTDFCARNAVRQEARRAELRDARGYVRDLKAAGVPITHVETLHRRWGERNGFPVAENWAPREMVEIAYTATSMVPWIQGALTMKTLEDHDSIVKIIRNVYTNEALRTTIKLGLDPEDVVRTVAKELGIKLRKDQE